MQPLTLMFDWLLKQIKIKQLDKIQKHLQNLGYLVLDRDPTDKERFNNKKIVKFKRNRE